MATRAGATRRTFTISFPVDLANQVERIAAEESRTTSELFREAFRTYRAQRVRASLAAFRAAVKEKGHNGYGPEDVERLVDEVRAERAAELRAERAAEEQ
jgi:predicted transcriptional regulator